MCATCQQESAAAGPLAPAPRNPCLAYLETYDGPDAHVFVPCVVIATWSDGLSDKVEIRITATRGRFRRGQRYIRNTTSVVPREFVRRVAGKLCVRSGDGSFPFWNWRRLSGPNAYIPHRGQLPAASAELWREISR